MPPCATLLAVLTMMLAVQRRPWMKQMWSFVGWQCLGAHWLVELAVPDVEEREDPAQAQQAVRVW